VRAPFLENEDAQVYGRRRRRSVAREPSCIQEQPSPSKTITRRFGARALAEPGATRRPMSPRSRSERSSGASVRHAGEGCHVGTQTAFSPRAASRSRRSTFRLDGISSSPGRPAPPPGRAARGSDGRLRDDMDVVPGPINVTRGTPKGVQQGRAEAAPSEWRDSRGSRVPTAERSPIR